MLAALLQGGLLASYGTRHKASKLDIGINQNPCYSQLTERLCLQTSEPRRGEGQTDAKTGLVAGAICVWLVPMLRGPAAL